MRVKVVKMTSLDNQDWLMMPYPEIFDKIMMIIGLSSLESLHRCRQVCSAWNVMIMQNIWENPRHRNILKMRIKETWDHKYPSEDDIPHAKWLGKQDKVSSERPKRDLRLTWD